MQNSSTKSLPLSEISSLVAIASGFLDEDDLEDAVLFHVMTFVTCSAGSTILEKTKWYEKTEILHPLN